MSAKPLAFGIASELMFLFLAILCLVILSDAQCHPQTCGSLQIPYPFRIRGARGSSCSNLPGFDIICKENATFGTGPIPFLPTNFSDFQILNIFKDQLVINSTDFMAHRCNSSVGVSLEIKLPAEGPFTISSSNKFVAAGCFWVGYFANESDWVVGGCVPVCDGNDDGNKDCTSGQLCCRTSIPANKKYFMVGANYWNISTGASRCTWSTIVDIDSFDQSRKAIDNIADGPHHMKIDWAIGNDNCSTAKRTNSFECGENADCFNAVRGSGYICNCTSGYDGDGYKHGTGCNDIDECKEPNLNNCSSTCKNTNGSYTCSCAKGVGDGFRNGTGCHVRNLRSLYTFSGIGVLSIVVVVGSFSLLWILKQRQISLLKQKNFELNGGYQLQQLISSSEGARERTRVFSLAELEKATDQFAENLVLGAGGYGTVYKGTLVEGTAVAIKKSKKVDQREIGQFINEVIILSQINHRNIVKLLGCCLETSVPLLVYEYVSNGTLFDHLDGEYNQHLGWENRLRIATETAEALSYLHSAASTPILHRDVKSSNILLDDTYAPKVADFGISRLIPMGQEHDPATAVGGTFGYLDPEYFRTGQLSDKSDVYSFGVVLVELLTSMKPVSFERMKSESNLADFFLSTMKMNRLIQILDPPLVEKNREESMHRVAILAKDCLHVEGEQRPSMKDVVQELIWISRGERISGREAHAWLEDVPANPEEAASLIEDGERSHECGSTDTCSISHSKPSMSFSIEDLRGSINSGR
eukprot:Gb_13338 [translate_table: standard]